MAMDTGTGTASGSPAAAAQESSSKAASTSPAPAARYRPWPLLVVLSNACLVLVGAVGALLLRVYFVHGGKRMFLPALLQICGWPLLLPPMCVSLCRSRSRSRRHGHGLADLLLPPRLAVAGAFLGALYAVPGFVYALGSRALPLSTSSLLVATQLAFTAVAAFVFVGLRFTPFSANAVVLLTVGPAVLGVGQQQPSGEGEASSSSASYYWIGFCETIASTALGGLVLPLVELAMARYGHYGAGASSPSYATVMQMQTVMGAAGTAVCLVGMAVGGDFQAVPREAAAFGLGKTSYYLVLVCIAVAWQLLNLGIMGLIACASSLLAGIMVAVRLPLSEILAVIFLHEKFDGPKGIALLLSLWGFASYLYGEKQQQQQNKKEQTTTDGDCLEARLLQIDENSTVVSVPERL